MTTGGGLLAVGGASALAVERTALEFLCRFTPRLFCPGSRGAS